MKPILHIVLSGLVIPVCMSCSSSVAYDAELQHIESIVESHPDSALSLLQSIDYRSLRNDRDKAMYGMLYTEASDKNHKILPDDSLATFAAEYFSEQGDKRRSMISLHYKGRVQYLNAKHTQSLVSFMKAHELATALDDRFWMGMTARGIADIYNESFHATEALNYAVKEYNYIKDSGRQPYLNYAMRDLANAKFNNAQYSEARALGESIIDSARVHNDTTLYNLTQRIIGDAYLVEGCYDKALPILEYVCSSDIAELSDSTSLTWAYVLTNQPQEALGIINQIHKTESLHASYARYLTFKALKQTDKALSELETAYDLTNNIFRQQVNRNLSGSIFDYFDLSKRNAATELKATRTRMWLIAVLSVMAVMALGITAYYIYNRQRHELYDKLRFVEQLQELLRQSKAESSRSSSTIQYLLSSQYELLEDLCAIVMRYTNQPESKQKIAESVTSIINNLSIRSERIVALERHVDEVYDNVFTSFCNDLPNLKEIDYRLFLFTVLGLSNTTISLLLKEDKLNAIYERKRRIKDKIKKLPADKCEWYASFF